MRDLTESTDPIQLPEPNRIDLRLGQGQIAVMSATDVARALSKLQNLSPDRAEKVVSLIDDLAELEALEDAEDLKDAREALAEIKAASRGAPAGSSDGSAKPGPVSEAEGAIPYEQFRRQLERER